MIATLNKISSVHNSCEDSLFVKEDNNFIYGGVFDGCSTGTKSHWASQTFAYAFARHQIPSSDDAVFDVWNDLGQMMDELKLDHMNMLSTCILFSYHKETQQLRLRIFGDGTYFINDVEHQVEQDNTPDYFGYHLGDNLFGFGRYMARYPEQVYENVTKFQICSDGIGSITRSQFAPPTDLEPLKMLLHPPTGSNYLERQWNILKRNHFTLSDDLSIISYVTD